jgi:hypothetical protein
VATDHIDNVYKLLQTFSSSLTSKFSLPYASNPEDQLKAPTESLIKDIGAWFGFKIETVTEIQEKEIFGRPDMGVMVKGLLTGHVELKAPGKGADVKKLKGADRAQWDKFKDLPNILYTDGNEWALYQDGKRVDKLIRLSGDVTADGNEAVNKDNARDIQELFRVFLRWEPITPSSPKALAGLLAPLCRLLRNNVEAALRVVDSNMKALADDWREYLFPDADDSQFADAYAQTFTYALLLARLSGEARMSTRDAAKAIRAGHHLLADALNILGNEAAVNEIAMPVNLLERVISSVDVAALGRKSKGDPWLYFYEDFLASYDPKLRKDRGVYYTPVQIVRAQVRLVAQLLEERFDACDAFADPKVVTLDPACGTGTYILAALQYSLNKVAETKGPGMRVGAAASAAKNMHAFEILVGPYAVAHLRLTQQILSEKASLPPDGVHVYLTDTLESPFAPSPHYPALYKPLGLEHARARKIKTETPILVCIGNPPYDRQTIDKDAVYIERRKGGWVRFSDTGKDGSGILRDFLTPLKSIDSSVHAKNLYNDYVYFWRWALWKVFEPMKGDSGADIKKETPGIVSFITASSYLRGPGFAGMRKVMREIFEEMWIIDLEGDNLGARKTDNVFAIQTPVAIAIGTRTRTPAPDQPASIHYTRIEGTSDEKLAQLAGIEKFSDLQWQTCPAGWTDPFIPVPETPYGTWPLLTDIFPWQANGMQFKRSWPIAETEEVLIRRWKELITNSSDKNTLFRESRDRKIDCTYPSLDGSGDKYPRIDSLDSTAPLPLIQKVGYRSFDRQWAITDARVGDFLRPTLHQSYGPRQVFLTSLLTEVLGDGPSAIATNLVPDLHYFRGSFGAKHVVPLWRDNKGCERNVTEGVLSLLSTAYGGSITAEDLFAYTYAVLFSPRYVRTFWEELRTPGPRLPIPKDRSLFSRLTSLGKELIWIHTYGERFIPAGKKTGQIPVGQSRCVVGTPTTPQDYPEDFGYDSGRKELHVGKGVFGNVRPEVWEFSVSGFQIVDSWLGYRMKKRSGKKSSALDDIRPTVWQFDQELLDLLWVLDATIDRLPKVNSLFEELMNSEHFLAADFPLPTTDEKMGPKGSLSKDSQSLGL